MAAPTFVGSEYEFGTGGSVSVPAPAGLAVGDHQLIIAVSGTEGSGMAAPTGFSPAGSFAGEGGDSTMYTAAFIASNASSTGPITIDNPTSGRLLLIARLAWRGGPGWLSTPAPSSTTRTSSSSHALPAQATTAADQRVVGAIVYDTGDGTGITTSFTQPTGWATRAAIDDPGDSTFERVAIGAFDIARSGSGSQTGTVQASRADVPFVWSATLGAAAATGPQPVTESGTLAAVVSEVYSNRINGSGDETYDVPTSAQASAMAGAFGKLMIGDFTGAATDVDPSGYDVVLFTDTSNSRQYAFLRERTPCSRFWGFYAWSRQGDRGALVVEAPHPKFDLYTHTEAGALVTKANARAFLLSTVHRNSNAATDGDGDTVGDVANYDGESVFQRVHETVALDGTDTVQIHGYGNSTDPDYDILVSEGQPEPSARTLQLAQDLRDSPGAFRVGIYDGVIGTALGATMNKQGQYSRPLGRYWCHVEQNSTVRSSATNRGYVEDVLAAGIPGPANPAPGQLFDLSRWHLTLPTEDPSDGDAAQIDQPQLATYTDAYNYTEAGEIVCRAPAVGATTSGASGATRDEYREHEAGSYANSAWDPLTTGRRQLTITTRADLTSIAGGTAPRKEGVVFQIHGAGDSPIPLIIAAEYHVATPRIRIFLNGPGFANPVVGITPDTKITIRCRVEAARMKLWVIAGLPTDLGPTPTYDWPISGTFTDLLGWYFKWGIYNKTTITSGSTGEGVARISYVESLQPGDPEPVPLVSPGRMLLALP